MKQAASASMSKIASDLMFDILPIVIQSDRKKRNVEDEKEAHVNEYTTSSHEGNAIAAETTTTAIRGRATEGASAKTL